MCSISPRAAPDPSSGEGFLKNCGFQVDADINASRNIATSSRSDRSRLQFQPAKCGQYCAGIRKIMSINA
jgi:transposase